ncbi:unnamed protein product [Arabidopsis thaliana]|uniref:(thale cress) hypothetical protein n=1 Tax=Arabidopsis thaliana TaxID=3702 RepID=A0A7G2E6P6_ARATH|nr:unnamed protein product [Arabidopsis thaliana]
MYEMHFAVPMTGAVLNPINTRLDAKTIAIILRHAQPKCLFVDYTFAPLIQEVLRLLPFDASKLHPLIISIIEIDSTTKRSSMELDYEGLIRKGDLTLSSSASLLRVHNEHDPISLNYTSGTTSEPKGSRTNQSHKSLPVRVLTGGSSPPAALLEKVERLGFQVMHVYGLTEASGAALYCEWQDEWNRLPKHQQMKLKARQGVRNITLDEVDVKNTKTRESVPRDGITMGEIVLKGNIVMKGYLKNPKATSEVFKHGWLNTGDIGVIHPDGHIEIKDRSKDIIISGGENISSIEVERVLYEHQKVLEAAVVAMPHPLWGETPCAFVVLNQGETNQRDREKESVTKEGDLIKYCRENMPHFMCPRKVVFLEELPKNGNGKILKPNLSLRDIAKGLVVDEDDTRSKKVQGRGGNNVSSRL